VAYPAISRPCDGVTAVLGNFWLPNKILNRGTLIEYTVYLLYLIHVIPIGISLKKSVKFLILRVSRGGVGLGS
jgi:hypothetical protein